MKYIEYGFLMLMVLIVGNGIRHLFWEPVVTKYKTVILSKLLLIIGVVCTIIFSTITWFLLETDTVISQIIFMLFSFLSSSLIIGYCNCRIQYDDNEFTVKNFWGIKHTYSYRDITGIYGKKKDVKLFLGKRMVRIDELAVGKYQFLSFAKKQYRKWNQGKSIPVVLPKIDIFKGNIENPGQILAVYFFILLLVAATLIVLYTQVIINTIKAENLKYTSLIFHQCEMVDEDLKLCADGDSQYYHISDYENWIEDIDKFISLCNGQTEFEIGYKILEDKNDSYCEIVSMAVKEGISFFTLDDVNQRHVEEGWKAFWFLAGMGIIWCIFIVVSIYVGRNPQKFSLRFVSFFFKKDCILYQHHKK